MPEWKYSEVIKRGGCWGYFKTHIPTGRQKFVACNWKTKKEAVAALEKESLQWPN